MTHFIGALMLEDIPNGMFVTTADHFSSAAETAAAVSLKESNGHSQTTELIQQLYGVLRGGSRGSDASYT